MQPGPRTIAAAPRYNWINTEAVTGVSHQRSEIGRAHLRDGTSNTYLFGEKYVEPRFYETFSKTGDTQPVYLGYDEDNNRWTMTGPAQDRDGLDLDFGFGSAHSGGSYYVFCDGSVRMVNYGWSWRSTAA